MKICHPLFPAVGHVAPQFKHLLLWMGKHLVSSLGGKYSSGWWEVNSMFWFCISYFVKIMFTFKLRRPDGEAMSGRTLSALHPSKFIVSKSYVCKYKMGFHNLLVLHWEKDEKHPSSGLLTQNSKATSQERTLKLDLFSLVERQASWLIEDQNTVRQKVIE